MLKVSISSSFIYTLTTAEQLSALNVDLSTELYASNNNRHAADLHSLSKMSET